MRSLDLIDRIATVLTVVGAALVAAGLTGAGALVAWGWVP